MRRTSWRSLAGAFVLAMTCAAPLAAQAATSGLVIPPMTPEQEATAHEAMTRLRSPYTPFHTVDMCPSSGALRDSIRIMAANGMSMHEIVEDEIARHGEEMRLLPKKSGAGLWAWLAPPLALLIGAGVIVTRLRRGRNEMERFPAPPIQLSDEDHDRVAAALRQWDRTGEVDG